MIAALFVTFDLYGVVVQVEAPPGPFGSAIWKLLADLPRSEEAPEHRLIIDRDGTIRYDETVVAECQGPTLAAAWTLWCLTQVACRSRTRAVLHAAAVGRGGRALIMPGAPGAGKSTLATALVLAGWSMLSDELAGLDLIADLVHPFPRPVALSPTSLAQLPPLVGPGWQGPGSELHFRIDELRSGSAAPELVPGAVMFVRYRPRGTGRPLAMAKAEALVRLTEHAMNLPSLGGVAFTALCGLVQRCPTYTIEVDDISTAVAGVRAISLAQEVLPTGRPATVTDGVQAVDLGGEVVVYDAGEVAVHRLNREAVIVWRLALLYDNVNRVIGEVSRSLGVRGDVVSAQVLETIERLRQLRLLEA